MLFDLFSETLRPLAKAALKRGFENFARANGTFERLRRNAEPLGAAHECGLGTSRVVAVEVRRGIALQSMQLNETGHADVSFGVSAGELIRPRLAIRVALARLRRNSRRPSGSFSCRPRRPGSIRRERRRGLRRSPSD